MSTRAHIRIKDEHEQIMLYHHSDGYPSGIGAELKSFLAKQYRPDWWDVSKIANDLVKGKLTDYRGRPDNGYEVTTCIHGDEEYVYVIDVDANSIKCYRHAWDQSYEDCVKPEREVEIPE